MLSYVGQNRTGDCRFPKIKNCTYKFNNEKIIIMLEVNLNRSFAMAFPRDKNANVCHVKCAGFFILDNNLNVTIVFQKL